MNPPMWDLGLSQNQQYVHTRGSSQQSENKKLVDGTFDKIQDQTLTCVKEEKTS